MAKKQIQQDERYHDTLLLLKRYRDVVWSLTVSVEQVKSDFRDCFGESIDEFLDSIYTAGADLSGTDIEERAKSIERSNKMLKLVNNAALCMRENHKYGEMYYKILYYSYFSPHVYHSNEEITEQLNRDGFTMCSKTMTKTRSLAVDCVGSILWGYTAKDSRAILEKFVR